GSHWERDTDALFPRLFVTYLAVTQFLVPFPVGHLGVVAIPIILWAFFCITDGIAGLRTFSFKPSGVFGKDLRLDAVIGSAILVIHTGSIALAARNQFTFPSASTHLRGATWLHLPNEQATRFEAIAQNVGKNCNTLFTMPGMASFNLWSGIPTPNGWNMTGWMKGISSERQAETLSI